eukprot:scaffold39191_cov140-Skeletonema_marinoi.AAC.12
MLLEKHSRVNLPDVPLREGGVGSWKWCVQKLGGEDSSTGGINSESPQRIGIGMGIWELLLHVAGTPVTRLTLTLITHACRTESWLFFFYGILVLGFEIKIAPSIESSRSTMIFAVAISNKQQPTIPTQLVTTNTI